MKIAFWVLMYLIGIPIAIYIGWNFAPFVLFLAFIVGVCILLYLAIESDKDV